MSDSGDASETPVVVDKLNALQLNTDEEEGEEEELSQAVVNRLVALKQIHNDVEEVNSKYKLERAALEKKYDLLRSPILEKRKDIVSGDVEVELEGTDSVSEADDKDKVTGIPGFWYQCIANHPAIGTLLSEDDLGALEALTNISCEYNDDYSGFKLTFTFRENEYFTNTELVKSYSVSPDLLEEKAPALTSVDGTKIEWKHKKNLCMTEVKKKQKAKSGRKAGQIRFVTKLEAKQSFFHFFSDPRLDDGDDEDSENEGGHKEGEHEFQLSIDEDYEAGHAFRAEIIPDAILWFTGEALDEEDEDEDDVDYGDDDDDDDDDNENDDDDDEDEDGPSSSSVPTTGGSGEQPECKQS